MLECYGAGMLRTSASSNFNFRVEGDRVARPEVFEGRDLSLNQHALRKASERSTLKLNLDEALMRLFNEC